MVVLSLKEVQSCVVCLVCFCFYRSVILLAFLFDFFFHLFFCVSLVQFPSFLVYTFPFSIFLHFFFSLSKFLASSFFISHYLLFMKSKKKKCNVFKDTIITHKISSIESADIFTYYIKYFIVAKLCLSFLQKTFLPCIR